MEIDFTKPVEAYHEDGRTMPISSIHPWGNDQWPWCGVADTEHIYMGRHGCSRSSYGDMPGWGIRNRQSEERFTPASECPPIASEIPINRELWERCVGLVREVAKVCVLTYDYMGNPISGAQEANDIADEAREIAKLLPVVEDDPDIQMVRDILHAYQRSMTPPDSGWGNMSYAKGSYDDTDTFKAALAAYKAARGREAK